MAKKLYYKIGEACKRLDIQPYVLRYWETEFPFLKPGKSRGGQRVYTPEELEVIGRIKQLLYEEGYTIAGAKKRLEIELRAGDGGLTSEAGDAGEAASPGVEGQGASPKRRGRGSSASGEAATAPDSAGTSQGAEAPRALDSGAAERVETLLAGLRVALDQSREILRLLEPDSR